MYWNYEKNNKNIAYSEQNETYLIVVLDSIAVELMKSTLSIELAHMHLEQD